MAILKETPIRGRQRLLLTVLSEVLPAVLAVRLRLQRLAAQTAALVIRAAPPAVIRHPVVLLPVDLLVALDLPAAIRRPVALLPVDLLAVPVIPLVDLMGAVPPVPMALPTVDAANQI